MLQGGLLEEKIAEGGQPREDGREEKGVDR